MKSRPTLAVFWTAVACFAGTTACTPEPETVSNKQQVFHFKDAAHRENLETVAILTPREPATNDLWRSLVEELTGEFNIATIPIEKSTGVHHIAAELDRLRPHCLIVVDNRTLSLYRALQQARPQHEFPPAIVVMSSYLDRALGGLRSTTGIAYEVPAVSSLVALREVSRHPVRKVGVVHRATFEEFVTMQRQLAAIEKVQLVAAKVSDSPTQAAVEDSLDALVEDENVDALWVLNDNRLLTPELIAHSWLPVLRFEPRPVLVGVEALVHPEIHFGTLAVLPDHPKLGVQAANMVFDLADNGWQLQTDGQVEHPVSVRTVINVDQMAEHFQLRPEALNKFDQAVE